MQNAVMETQSLSPQADVARGLSAELSTLSKRQNEVLQNLHTSVCLHKRLTPTTDGVSAL